MQLRKLRKTDFLASKATRRETARDFLAVSFCKNRREHWRELNRKFSDSYHGFVEISSYIPGRVRLHSKKLVNNPDLEQQVKAQLGAFAELDEIETSTVTGSILIKYKPEQLQKNAELRKVEDYIKMNARRK